MLPVVRFASVAAALFAIIALPLACGFPDYGGFQHTSSSGGGQGGGNASSGTAIGGRGQGGGTTGCRSDADCAGDPAGTVCDTTRHDCVECTPDDHSACSSIEYCADSDTCLPGCNSDADCNPEGSAGGLTCDRKNHLCLGCSTDDQCPDGLVCEVATTTCIPGCTPQHKCQTGHTCCGTTCSDVTKDVMNCGACDMPCQPANGMGACVDSKCTIDTCNPGFHDCDMDPTNGCESDSQNDADHCGSCTHKCPLPNNAAAACMNGQCGLGACNDHFGNCDGDATNGCEVNLLTNAQNCGDCGLPCSNNHGTPSCSAGACGIACDAGFKDCDMDVTNGCEVDTSNNVNNCGQCLNVCPPQGGTPACVNSSCTVSNCAAGKGDCDGNPGNGCEANLTNDPLNCGGCGLPCTPQHGTGTCAASACQIQGCDAGFRDCDNQYATGCEINIQTDKDNCGSCGNGCTNGHGTTSCVSGTCTPVCAAGFQTCDSNPNNGCETNLNTDPLNCGVCGKKCIFANGSGACQAGTCVLTGCNAGFADCDLNPVNGCEVALNTTMNCGICGRQCTNANGSTTCSGGVCVPTCSANFGDCDMNPNNGCETGTATDTTNCGSCGAVCSSANGNPSCAGGNCSIVCTAPFKDCNNNARTDGCEVNTNSDPQHCGNCTTVCSGGTPNCVGGTCTAVGCTAGRSDCDSNPNTGPGGCECATTGCCGSGCQITHQDGLGQNFLDCAAVGTHNSAQATEAATAWNAAGDIIGAQCSTRIGPTTYLENVICNQTSTQCACWAYSDTPVSGNNPYTGAGYVLDTIMPGNPGTLDNCFCPVDPTPAPAPNVKAAWN